MTCPIHAEKAGDGPDPGDGRPVEEEGVIQRFIGRYLDIVSSYFDSLVDALEAGAIDPAAGSLSLQLRDLFDEHRARFVTTFRQGWRDGYSTGREAAIRQQDLDISFEVEHPQVEEQLRRNGERAAEQVELTIVGNLADALVEANRRGLGIYADERTGEPGIIDVLQEEVFQNAPDYRAEQVARTETISASNYGAAKAYEDSAATLKVWQATDDSRTRPTHVAADQQTVSMDENFTVGGFPAEFPGDPSLPPQERIQCRCAIRPAGFEI